MDDSNHSWHPDSRCAVRMPTSANEVSAALALGAVSYAGLLIGAIAEAFSRRARRRFDALGTMRFATRILSVLRGRTIG
jgi:hypothetical protein